MEQSNKYSNYVFTWNSDDKDTLPDNSKLVKYLESVTESFAFQLELGSETKRLHIQGCFKLCIRKRKDTLIREFEKEFGRDLVLRLRLDKMEGKWKQAVEYCTKSEGRVGDTPFLSENLVSYSGRDIQLFRDSTKWFGWQNAIYVKLFNIRTGVCTVADDRTIIWITDTLGNSGKSKFCKFVCHTNKCAVKIPFGTATQIRSAVISAGPKKVYFLDIPRTLGDDDSINSIISAVEDIKNGFVTSAMYGKFQTMTFDPPHIIIFSNDPCPVTMMSIDRWERYYINQMNKMLEYVKC